MNIPNMITLVRLVLVPVIVWLLIRQSFLAALIVFVLAGISDGLDGYIAKRFDMRTELGAYLDAIADKLLLVSIYVTLGIDGHIPAWLVILVVSRDVLIVGAFILSWLMGRPVAVHPLMVSKVNTVGQIVLAGLVLSVNGLGLAFGPALTAGHFCVAGLTIASAIAYSITWLQETTRWEGERTGHYETGHDKTDHDKTGHDRSDREKIRTGR